MSEIVWLENVSHQPYVRELYVDSRTRRGRIAYRGNGRAVGYENLAADTKGNGGFYPYRRRCFWLAPWDPYDPPGTGNWWPIEAVDPRTLEEPRE